MASADPSTKWSDFDLASLDADAACAARETAVATLAADADAAAAAIMARACDPIDPIGQLACDVASIEFARDALMASDDRNPPVALRHLRSTRGNDRVPVMLGCLFALQMLIAFIALSAFAKFVR